MTASVVGFFGKLPWHGDFLRDAPANAPLDLIDAWLASAPIGPPGPHSAAFDAAGPALAMVRARGMWWAMALFPSQDAVGRRFPFCVLAGHPEGDFGGEPGLVPMAWAPFLVRCLQQAARGWPQDAAGLRQAVFACLPAIDPEAEGRRLVEALADERQDALWRGVADRAAVWADLTSLAGDPERAAGVRLRQLGHQRHLAFVLMLMHLASGASFAPVFIGMQPGRPDEAPGATVLWGRPSAGECLAALWPTLPGAAGGRIHDLPTAAGAFGDADDAPDALADPQASLRDLLHQAGSATRRHVRRPRPA